MQASELVLAVGVVAREQDHVVSALHRANTVHLHKADAMDQLLQARLGQLGAQGLCQPMPGQKQAASIGIGNRHNSHNALNPAFFAFCATI